jgi:hypothetical protein
MFGCMPYSETLTESRFCLGLTWAILAAWAILATFASRRLLRREDALGG